MRAHTITTKGRGRTKRTIVPGGILALSLAVVLLAATASTASAEALLGSPTGWNGSFDFGDRQVGTTSPAAVFGLKVVCTPQRPVHCNKTFNPRISVSGDYAQTNDCPPTLQSGRPATRCTINVAFTPTSAGPKQGTLSAGPGGPTVALSGNGVTTPTPPALPLTLDLSAEVWDWCGWRCKKPDDYFIWRAPLGQQPLVLKKKLTFIATTNNWEDESTVVASGGVKKTTKQMLGGETEVKAKLKHPKRLNDGPTRGNPKHCRPVRRGCTTVKLNVAVTDEFGQTTTEELRVTLYRNPTL